MKVKIKTYKRVLLSYEATVEVPPVFSKEDLLQAFSEYAPDSLDSWEDELDTLYDTDVGSGVPKPSVTYIEGPLIVFLPETKRIVNFEKP